jgi:MSHA biogenesis protein MshQ
MAFQNGWRGPNIVSNGLVLYLDAASPNSYRRDFGSTWRDISGLNNHMSLINNPTFVTGSGESSYLSFDGANDYGITTVPVPDTTTGDRCCFECFCYGPMTNSTMLMAWGTGIHDIFINAGGIGFNTYASDSYGIATAPIANTWNHIVVNFYRGNYTLGSIYLNSVQQSLSYFNGTQNASNARFAGGELRIGAGGDGYNGNWRFNTVKVYNRELSSTEILQNYNVLKSRFGL